MTHDAVKDLVSKRLHDTSTAMKTAVGEWANEIMHKMLSFSETWSFMEGDGSFATTANDETYLIASQIGVSDLRRFLSLRIEAENRTLRPITIEQYEREYTDPTVESGLPRDYTVWANTLRLGPRPDAIYTVAFRYYKKQADISGATSPPWSTSPLSLEYDHIWVAGTAALGMQFNDDGRSSQEWARFFSGMRRMLGDDQMVDEEIICTPFSRRDDAGLIVDRSYPPHLF